MQEKAQQPSTVAVLFVPDFLNLKFFRKPTPHIQCLYRKKKQSQVAFNVLTKY